MRRWPGLLAAFLLAALIGHIALLYEVPGFIMSTAMSRMASRGVPLHGFYRAPQMTPMTQTVVRPSPDLAYSICRFDLSQTKNGIEVRMAAYPAYSSVSFFDDRTNNFAARRGNGAAVTIRLLPPGSPAGGANVTVSPSDRGLILIRRLAPDSASFEKAKQSARGDYCRVF